MDEHQRRPLLRRRSTPDPDRTKLLLKAISLTFQSVSNLANLLPTGTVFVFQLLSPIFSDKDSFRDDKGVVHYGIATLRGLWIIDDSITVPPEDASEYQLKFIDFLHAFMSTLVFAAITLFDQNVVNCFYPTPSEETMELLTALPVGIGVIGSAFFVTFPTTRHGIGFPLSSR
ncbi:protein DMP4-like [Telopea speciosissima]|uniref:protein DMP4-like n=1 Tax=Telopea speciosissima TaxID=54955 RepID=UPI001CC40AA5|nr:protein DMP4-like [Telopea speciosissima]